MASISSAEETLPFKSRRSPVISLHGAVASSQPLASEIGVQILKTGGNAADAAVAIAAALNVTEPCSTGIGGDCFCLFYDAKEKKVRGLNGSGCAPSQLTLEKLEQEGVTGNALHPLSAHTVTVPGAAAAWVDTVDKFGSKRVSMLDILNPAIALADKGFPVHPVAAEMWKKGEQCLLHNKFGRDMLLEGRAPMAGEIMRMPFLAQTFQELAVKGKDGFYKGKVAKAIASVVQEHGGLLSTKDLANHKSTFDEPISTNYRGIDIWEMPPNGQGITALIALNILEGFDLKSMGYHSMHHLHTMIEAMRVAFADTRWYNADPAHVSVPVEKLISKSYAQQRRTLINPNRALSECHRGSPTSSSDTVYFTVVDQEGNACSFINSNYMGFGTGLVPEGCGFTLQNRGANFSLLPGHPNALAPGKRPYHTIIPAMATFADTGELYASFGVMGGFMQPQGHVQVLVNMIDFEMDPQQALDMPRFCVGPGHEGAEGSVSFEEGIPESTIEQLKALGHVIEGPVTGFNRKLFGRGQIIARRVSKFPGGSNQPVYWTGSDARADGMAIGF